MSYFSNFKTINYDVKGVKGNKQFAQLKNILTRIRMKTEFIKNRVFYSDYMVMDGETPESVAHDFYGDTGLHWIVMYAQQMTNPYYDWPMTYYNLVKYSDKKYGDDKLEAHHWEDSIGNEVNEPGSIVGNGTGNDPNVLEATVDVYGFATKITNIEYEERENEKRRSINLIRPDYVNAVKKEFEKLLKK